MGKGRARKGGRRRNGTVGGQREGKGRERKRRRREWRRENGGEDRMCDKGRKGEEGGNDGGAEGI